MTVDEKTELGNLLDSHKIKSVFYVENDVYTKGVYFVQTRDGSGLSVVEEIYGVDLEG